MAFTGHYNEESAPAADSSVRYPKLFYNAPLDLLGPDSSLLGRVRLVKFTPWSLELARLPGDIELPEVDVESVVHVQGRSEDLTPFLLRAIVDSASKLKLTLKNPVPIDQFGRRSSFRYGIWRPAEVVCEGDKIAPCVLENLSFTGAMIGTDSQYGLGERLRLRVELYDHGGPISFWSKVVWILQKTDGKWKYGLLFEELTRSKRKLLEDDFQVMQEQALLRVGQ